MTSNIRLKETKQAARFVSANPKKAIEILGKYNQVPVLDDIDLLQLKVLSEAYYKIGDENKSSLFDNLAQFFSLDSEALSSHYSSIVKEGNNVVRLLLTEDSFERNALFKVIVYFYKEGKQLESSLLYYLYKKLFGKDSVLDELMHFKVRGLIDFLDYILTKKADWIIVCDCLFEEEVFEALLIKKVLSFLKLNANLVTRESFGIHDIDICLKTMEVENVKQFLLKTYENNINQKPIVVLGTSNLIKKIARQKGMYRYFEVLFRQSCELPVPYYDCVLLGDFRQTSNFLYGLNVEDCLDNNQPYDYSIIIPARNSSEFLKYALLTCLNVDYDKHRFEVLVSDNSDQGNTQIKELVEDYQKEYENLSYVKAPFPLSLPRTFEFAYLAAKGKKIISLGSDDGILRYSLNELDRVFRENNDPLLVHFQSVDYIWPSKKNKRALLAYKRICFNDKKHETILNSTDMFFDFICGKYPFTFLPILYMRTCIKKQLISKIIDVTGKFEFGYSQDIYTGIVNLLLLDSLVYTSLPLIIGGGSPIGVGKLVKNSELNPKVYKFGMRNANICYYHYFSQKSEDLYWGSIYTENERWFIFTEYSKINDLAVFGNRHLPLYPIDGIIQSFGSMFELYDFNTKDSNYLHYWVQHCAELLGGDVIQTLKLKKNSLIEARRKAIKKYRIKQFAKKIDVFGLLRIINNLFKKRYTKRGLGQDSSGNGGLKPLITYDSKNSIYIYDKRKGLQDVFEASKLLETPKYKALILK